MRRCLELASKGKGQVSPNPMVGAVIVHENKIIGEGFHQIFGGPHAEVNAINTIKNKSILKDSTLYVNLEPCSHFGKTPPCCNTIVEFGIKKVIIGSSDPNEKVNGRGIDFLKNNKVEVVNNILKEESEELNRKFFTFQKKKRPFITLKWAETIDGFIDKKRESNQKKINWITSKNTKALVHKWRSEHDAILVGRKTIENDNPSLTVRLIDGKNPLRIVIDPLLSLNKDFTIFNDNYPIVIFNEKIEEDQGKVRYIKYTKNNITSDLNNYLYKEGKQSLLIEGGATTINSFLKNHKWDEAKVLIGNKKFKNGIISPKIKNSLPFSISTHGEDKIIEYRND